MDRSLTDAVYRFICDYIEDNHIAPSYQEIAEGCFIGISSIEKHLIKLEADKRIERTPRVPRSIRLINPDDED